jgi:tight adherence protein C
MKVLAGWIAAVLLTIWIAGLAFSLNRTSVKLSLGAGNKELAAAVTLPFLLLLTRSPLREPLLPFLAGLHTKLAHLNPSGYRLEDTRHFAAAAMRNAYAALIGASALSWIGGEPALLFIGGLIACLLPAVQIRDVYRKAERRKQDILLALPELLGKLMLLVGAGDTVQSALFRCAAGPEQSGDHPLYLELGRSINAMRNGESIQRSLEQLSKRCAVQEVSIFTATLLLNYRRGGETFVLSLRELSYTLWEKRKAVARMRGEEASSKLVFPLVTVFFVLMVLVASPAFLMMS